MRQFRTAFRRMGTDAMKIVAYSLCLAYLLYALNLSAFALGNGALAVAAPFDSAANPTLNQQTDAPQPDANISFRFDHILTEQGLSSGEVWSILRDRRGFLWFGTLDGLDRFDGYNVKVFLYFLTDPASLSDNAIRTICEDRSGTLWIGTWTGRLNRYDHDSETFTRFQHDPHNPDSLSDNNITTHRDCAKHGYDTGD